MGQSTDRRDVGSCTDLGGVHSTTVHGYSLWSLGRLKGPGRASDSRKKKMEEDGVCACVFVC